MQQAVYDDASKFLVECGSKQLGIAPDGVDADVDVAAQRVATAVVEADVVGVVVVSDEASVDVEHGFIIDEDVVNVAHDLSVALCHLPDPRRDLCLANVRHCRSLCVERNHSACKSSTAFFTTSSFS